MTTDKPKLVHFLFNSCLLAQQTKVSGLKLFAATQLIHFSPKLTKKMPENCHAGELCLIC